MGTFHEDAHPLHGITVVVDTTGPDIWVGRCEGMDRRQVVLLDADVHRDGADGRSKQEYVARAVRYGVWKKYDRIGIDRAAVASVRRLGDL